MYGIYHSPWTILRSSYRKLAWIGFEPMTNKFHSDALTDWAIRPWVQLTLRAKFKQLLQFHLLLSVRFHLSYCLHQSPHLFNWSFCIGNHMILVEWTGRYGIHHWTILRSSNRKLALVGFEPTTTEFYSYALTNWAIRPRIQLAFTVNFKPLIQFHLLFSVRFHFSYYLRQSPCLVNRSLL